MHLLRISARIIISRRDYRMPYTVCDVCESPTNCFGAYVLFVYKCFINKSPTALISIANKITNTVNSIAFVDKMSWNPNCDLEIVVFFTIPHCSVILLVTLLRVCSGSSRVTSRGIYFTVSLKLRPADCVCRTALSTVAFTIHSSRAARRIHRAK